MTAIMAAFKEWEHLLRSVEDQVVVYSDHKNLEYFNSSKILNRRQHRWAEFLQPFNFKVIYREGRLNEKADTLSRRRDYRPEGGGEIPENSVQKFFRPGQYELEPERMLLHSAALRKMTASKLSSSFEDQLRRAGLDDPEYIRILAIKKDPKKRDLSDKTISEQDGLLYVNSRWLVPDNKDLKNMILQAEHDSRVAGHF
jgi:hypothetical protein